MGLKLQGSQQLLRKIRDLEFRRRDLSPQAVISLPNRKRSQVQKAAPRNLAVLTMKVLKKIKDGSTIIKDQ